VIRTAAAVVLSICVLCGSARADGFPEKFKGGSLTLVSWMKIGFSRIRERFLFGLLLNRSSKSFLMLCDLAEAYIAETENLVYGEFVKDSSLRKDSESRDFGEYQNFEVLDIERTETKTTSVKEGLYIDKGRALHLVYDDIKEDGALDFTLDTSGFREYADSFMRLTAVRPVVARKTSRRQPVTLLLYDRLTSMSSSLTGGEVPETAAFRKSKGAGLAVRFGPHNLVLTRPVDLGTADLAFIGLFPYRIGRETVYTFGLIAIVILTILLLWLTVAYTTGWLKLREVPAMGDNKKTPDIIDEIDQELSGERGKKEPETVRTPAGEKSGEEPAKKLEEDGIFIEK